MKKRYWLLGLGIMFCSLFIGTSTKAASSYTIDITDDVYNGIVQETGTGLSKGSVVLNFKQNISLYREVDLDLICKTYKLSASNFTVRGNGHTVKRGKLKKKDEANHITPYLGCMFYSSFKNVSFEDIIIDGTITPRIIEIEDSEYVCLPTGRLIEVYGGTLTINDSNVKLCNNINDSLTLNKENSLDPYQPYGDKDKTSTVTDTNGGGAITIDSGAIANISNVTIQNCHSCGGGGGINVTGGATLNLSGGTISNCASTYIHNKGSVKKGGRGGGILVDVGCTLNFSNGIILSCTAYSVDSTGGLGGGIYCLGKLTLSNKAEINNCTGEGGAGGVYLSGATATIKDNVKINDCETLLNDNVTPYGGGIAVMDGSTCTMNGGTVSNNKSKTGGGIYVSGNSMFTMNGGYIYGNAAIDTEKRGTGGIRNHESTVYLMGGIIGKNEKGELKSNTNSSANQAGGSILTNSGEGSESTLEGDLEVYTNDKISTAIFNNSGCTLNVGISLNLDCQTLIKNYGSCMVRSDMNASKRIIFKSSTARYGIYNTGTILLKNIWIDLTTPSVSYGVYNINDGSITLNQFPIISVSNGVGIFQNSTRYCSYGDGTDYISLSATTAAKIDKGTLNIMERLGGNSDVIKGLINIGVSGTMSTYQARYVGAVTNQGMLTVNGIHSYISNGLINRGSCVFNDGSITSNKNTIQNYGYFIQNGGSIELSASDTSSITLLNYGMYQINKGSINGNNKSTETIYNDNTLIIKGGTISTQSSKTSAYGPMQSPAITNNGMMETTGGTINHANSYTTSIQNLLSGNAIINGMNISNSASSGTMIYNAGAFSTSSCTYFGHQQRLINNTVTGTFKMISGVLSGHPINVITNQGNMEMTGGSVELTYSANSGTCITNIGELYLNGITIKNIHVPVVCDNKGSLEIGTKGNIEIGWEPRGSVSRLIRNGSAGTITVGRYAKMNLSSKVTAALPYTVLSSNPIENDGVFIQTGGDIDLSKMTYQGFENKGTYRITGGIMKGCSYSLRNATTGKAYIDGGTIKNTISCGIINLGFLNVDGGTVDGFDCAIDNRMSCSIISGVVKQNTSSGIAIIEMSEESNIEISGGIIGNSLSNQQINSSYGGVIKQTGGTVVKGKTAATVLSKGTLKLEDNYNNQEVNLGKEQYITVENPINTTIVTNLTPADYYSGRLMVKVDPKKCNPYQIIGKKLFTLTPLGDYALIPRWDGIYLGVKPKLTYEPEENPIIEPTPGTDVSESQVVYFEGEILPLDTLLYGLKASDELDGDLTSEISLQSVIYADGTIEKAPQYLNTDREKIGEGTMTYSVSNSIGLSASITLKFYILPNQAPKLEVSDTYYFLDEVKNKTSEELNDLCNKCVDYSDDYESKEELEKQYKLQQNIVAVSEGAFTVKVEVKDQYGHRFYMPKNVKERYGSGKLSEKSFTFHIVDDLAIKNMTTGYVRYISLDMLDTLSSKSKWRQPEMLAYLQQILNKDANNPDDCQEIWHFSGEDVEKVKEDILNNPDPFSEESNIAFREKWEPTNRDK